MSWGDILHPRHLTPDPEEWTPATLRVRLGRSVPASRLRAMMRGSLGDFLLAASMLLPILIATGLVNATLTAVLGLDPKDIETQVPVHPSAVDGVITFISIAILIPIGEEVFFRGYVTNAWARSLSRPSALLRAGLFFAFIHVINTTNTDFGTSLRVAAFNFGARVPVALALCWIYIRRRSLIASISLHGCYNGLIVLISFLATYPS